MSEVNDELATELEEADRQRSLQAATGKSYDTTKRFSHCVECGDDMNPDRAKTGASTCIECQEFIEKDKKWLGR